jgi:hypothetical protein
MGSYGKDEFDLAKARTGKGVRSGADQLICVSNAIAQMPAKFGTEELEKYLKDEGTPIAHRGVDRQLLHLKALVKCIEEKKVAKVWHRKWAKVVQ